MNKFMGLKQAADATGIKEYTLRLYCKQKKIRFNIAGNTKYILRIDWLEADLEKLALENMRPVESIVQIGRLRRIEA